ncbi:type I DNA topoisomerase [Desulfosarcina sp. OttesenSCG-928-A07]|nr:type I DNA topoisomerase [Desulfosarcina sp. OttesenSCG-928-G17]MDL2328400.1 type I DNA topoisomerase [Desulfosarcina sp. OttesenSCG-928-A07]
MTKPLVVVESPTKVRTIKKYLGNAYNVAATVGHIKDLPPKDLGIDIEHDFTPQYQTIPGKTKVLNELRSAAGDATDIYLAPDPDREGEAIAWHTADVLKKKGRRFHRVLFHELTQKAILESMKAAQSLDPNKYEAQQARRILDRLVGYQISPLLWRKVKSGLSAGRVQSVAVRIICDRERAIQAFEPVEYWSITASLKGNAPPPFTAKLTRKKGAKFDIPDEKTAMAVLADLNTAAFVVDKIVNRTTKKNPLPPFITSKLQQEAIRKLRFSAKKTMMIAQQLYEGIDLGPGEPVGLITYMRTDSTRIAEEAAQDALALITETFGDRYSYGKPRFFKNKNKAQDAHEAIRPASVRQTPDQVKPYLSKDQLLLYTLIWQRFVASQMAQALIDQKTLSIAAGDYTFTATGSSVQFPGFLAVYQSADDEAERSKGSQMLPELTEKSVLEVLGIEPKQHFTQPPPRFSEASLVKELEENGIGRPSTYAAILSTIRDKGYVDLLKGYFHPTELGFIVNELLTANFPDILDVEFTARLENDLDRVEQAEVKSLDILKGFYGPFSQKLHEAVDHMLSIKGVGLPTELMCPLCQKNPLRIKMGKNGHFLACSGYPECTYSSDYQRDEKGHIVPVAPPPAQVTDKVCDKCGSPMVVKRGRYGDFLACSGYPNCKQTQSLTGTGGGGSKATGVHCPEPGCTGEIVEKSSRRGKVFYGCNRYPDCSFASWDKPVAISCPDCESPYLLEKTTKRDGAQYVCPNRECRYRQPIDAPVNETE